MFQNWVAGIFVLIALLILLAVGLLAIIAVITLLRVWSGHVAQRRAAEQLHRERFRPDGTPYPPTARGICDRCGKAFEKVYYLPSGQRLCPEDYEALHGRDG